MNSKLFIGNISFQVDESQLEDAFAQVGEVRSVKIITDRATGRSRGFGFIEMGTPELAESAITELDGKDLGGRSIRVSIAEERKDRPSGGGGQRNGNGQRRNRY